MVNAEEFRKAIEKAKKKEDRFKSTLYNPRNQGYGRGLLSPRKTYSMRLFRRIAEKAWLINTIVGHIIDKVTPYLRPMSSKGSRGFEIKLKDPDAKMTEAEKKKAKELQEFLLKTAFPNIKLDPKVNLNHTDNLIHYAKKVIRDLLVLDQVAAEKLWTNGGDLLAFEAVDAGTIVRCTEEGYEGDDEIRYVQMIDSQVVTQYSDRQLCFQFQNPRTDIEHFGYGYSKIEQCVDLVVSLINSFNYNAGAFTEDKLPRGMLLLNGDMGFEEIEEIEDYIIDVMGPGGVGGAIGKWGIPIIPSGKSGDKTSITWQKLGESNQDMQFSRWQDTLYMSIGAVFGVDIESMGIKSEKGAKIMESGSAEGRKYSDDKGIGTALTFLEDHLQHFIDLADDRFMVVFHGFEQDDAKDQREAIESELKTKKSLNEIRRENDLDPIDQEWADIPGLQNPQYLQAYQGEKGMAQPSDEFDDKFGKAIKEDTIRIVI